MPGTHDNDSSGRREFFHLVAATGAGLIVSGCAAHRSTHKGGDARKDDGKGGGGEEKVSPSEDLMREHGVLKRVLLVYGEGLRRIDGNQEVPPEPLADAAKVIRDFIENYHEKLEEDYLFPRFRKANKLVDLVDVLTQQHQAGRRVTDVTLALATPQGLKDPDSRRRLADSMRQFIRMYSPHEAREDTELFPAFRKIVTPHEYDSLGEEFEKKEHQLFGGDGFEMMVDRVANIEKALGIYDLAQFTPRV
jgi:hemerythrin-like domain-containing protein